MQPVSVQMPVEQLSLAFARSHATPQLPQSLEVVSEVSQPLSALPSQLPQPLLQLGRQLPAAQEVLP